MAALESALLLLTVATLCRGVPVVEEIPRWQRDVTPSYNASELKCFEQNKVLFTDGQCYSLRNRGPCPRGSWLVLSQNQITLPDGTTRSFPECQEIRCTRSLTVWWPETRECKHLTRDKNSLCPNIGNKIYVNEYGEGECTCDANYARYEQDIVNGRGTDAEWVGNCYPLYRQGLCAANQIFQTAFLDGHGVVGVCEANPCLNSSMQNPGSAFARLNGQCYELDQKIGGPCLDNKTFSIHPWTKEPRCIEIGNSIVLLHLFTTSDRCNGNIDPNTKECRPQLGVVVNYIAPKINGSKKRPRTRSTRPK